MTFASDAQRRWWFANNGGGSSTGASSPSGGSSDPLLRNERKIEQAKALLPSLNLSDPDALAAYNDLQFYGKKYGTSID